MEQILTIDTSVRPIELAVLGIADPLQSDSTRIAADDIVILEVVSGDVNTDRSLVEEILSVAQQLQHSFDTVLLIIDGSGHLSLNTELPFSDPKKVAKLISPEVQDLVPFDLDECLVSYQHIGPHIESGEEFHVQVLPHAELSTVIAGLKGTPYEPRIVTTPGNLLAGLYELFRDQLETSAIVIFETSNWLYIGAAIQGKLVTERSIDIRNFAIPKQMDALVETEICAIEERYGAVLTTVYRIAQDVAPRYISPRDRTVQELSVASLFPKVVTSLSIAHLLAAPFAREYPAPRLLGNFRVGPLAYRPSWSYAINGTKQLAPIAVLLLIAAMITFSVWYGARQYSTVQLRSLLSEAILAEVPTFSSEPGLEAQTLQNLSQSLQDTLKDLGSPLGAPPLNVLSLLSVDISSIEGISVSRVAIRNGEVKLDGNAPNYKSLNQLESTLKKRKSLFCKSKTDSPSNNSREKGREFQMTLSLCES